MKVIITTMLLVMATITVSVKAYTAEGHYYNLNGQTVWCDYSGNTCYYWDVSHRRWIEYYHNGKYLNQNQNPRRHSYSHYRTRDNRPVVLRPQTYGRALDRITASALNTFISAINSQVSRAVRDAVD